MKQLAKNKALVMFSGGQDSAICLAAALAKYDHVETVGFIYGQRHEVELAARLRLREQFLQQPHYTHKLGQDTQLPLQALSEIGDTAMTADIDFADGEDQLPNSFVPGRNLAFLVMAGALAYRRDCGVLVGGMCQTDYSGYPDCREDSLEAQMQALRLGMECNFSLDTPLMFLTKAQSWELASELGGDWLIDLILEESHSCYRGERGARHPWGYGCGTCPACELRAAGWQRYKESL
ncbi:MAG: 7-cyano-7-deazaguanine synthase QueC [bacterium]